MRWRELLERDLFMRVDLYVLVGVAALFAVAYAVQAVAG